MARICLITPYHPAFQPRTVREADTLAEAGHEVRVVSCLVDEEVAQLDENLMRRRRWRLQAVDLRRRGRARLPWFRAVLWQRLHRALFHFASADTRVVARAYLRGYDRVLRAVVSEPADWYVAHTQPALPVAVAAAAYRRARAGFDCEDLLSDSGTDPAALVDAVERAHLARCDYVSVPTLAMGQELVRRYGIAPPLVLHNVFPLSLAANLRAPTLSAAPLRLHWLGQTIGAGRGLEGAIDSAGALASPVEIHLRGRVGNTYRLSLQRRAGQQACPPTLRFHPIVDHDEVVRSMHGFDVGLCLEQPEHANYSRTATNKVFAYLLAGLAIAATDTVGQREILGEIAAAGFLYSAGDREALARGLRRWQGAPGVLLEARQAAWNAARSHFCWEREAPRLLAALGV